MTTELDADLRGVVERGWFIECTRCSNTHEYIGEFESEAIAVFARLGWRVVWSDSEDVFCPGCSGEGPK